jgi:hypothetical protein
MTGYEPVVNPGDYVFVSVERVPPGVAPVASIQEHEGMTIVIARADADRLRLPYDFVASWISLMGTTTLGQGDTFANLVARLAENSVRCYVFAGFHHDHLFMPSDQLDDAMRILL